MKMKAAMLVAVTLVVLFQSQSKLSVDARPVVSSSDRSLIGKIQKRVEVEQIHRSSSLVGIIINTILSHAHITWLFFVLFITNLTIKIRTLFVCVKFSFSSSL